MRKTVKMKIGKYHCIRIDVLRLIIFTISSLALITSFCIGLCVGLSRERKSAKYEVVVTDPYLNNNDYTTIKTEEFIKNFIDVRKISGYETTEKGLYLHMEDGNGYYYKKNEAE